jgi:hypothetical protein
MGACCGWIRTRERDAFSVWRVTTVVLPALRAVVFSIRDGIFIPMGRPSGRRMAISVEYRAA